MYINSTAQLASLLERASQAHHEYEQETGVKDNNWHIWYAEWINEELAIQEIGRRAGRVVNSTLQ